MRATGWFEHGRPAGRPYHTLGGPGVVARVRRRDGQPAGRSLRRDGQISDRRRLLMHKLE